MELSQQRFNINNNPNKIPVWFKRHVKFYQRDAVKVLALTHISAERAWWGVLGGCRPLGLETRAPHHKAQGERCRLLTKYGAKDGSLFFCVVAQTGENHATGTSKAEQVSKQRTMWPHPSRLAVFSPDNVLYTHAWVCGYVFCGVQPCDPMECSPPGSSVHGISQARILEWGAVSYSRGSSLCSAAAI